MINALNKNVRLLELSLIISVRADHYPVIMEGTNQLPPPPPGRPVPPSRGEKWFLVAFCILTMSAMTGPAGKENPIWTDLMTLAMIVWLVRYFIRKRRYLKWVNNTNYFDTRFNKPPNAG
jgi:hypothetical protein